jgi:hypothetical protein
LDDAHSIMHAHMSIRVCLNFGPTYYPITG